MNPSLVRFAAALSLSLLAVAHAHAQRANATPEPAAKAASGELPPYESLDANGDGIVTLPEIVVHSPPLAARVRHCDADGDETMSREEYAACRPKAADAAGHR